MIPSSYNEQKNKCRKCYHCFVRYDNDVSNKYYCHQDKSFRPICGSLAIEGERFDLYDSSISKEASISRRIQQEKNWGAWELTHQVDASGNCEEWENKI